MNHLRNLKRLRQTRRLLQEYIAGITGKLLSPVSEKQLLDEWFFGKAAAATCGASG